MFHVQIIWGKEEEKEVGKYWGSRWTDGSPLCARSWSYW